MSNMNQVLQQIKRSVSANAPDATLILYGSYARGEQRKDSDIDILILLNKERITFNDRQKIGRPLYNIELETGINISPVIFSKAVWETKHRISSFYKNVIKEGKLL